MRGLQLGPVQEHHRHNWGCFSPSWSLASFPFLETPRNVWRHTKLQLAGAHRPCILAPCYSLGTWAYLEIAEMENLGVKHVVVLRKHPSVDNPSTAEFGLGIR